MKQKIFFEIGNFEVLKFTLEDYYKVSYVYTENPHSASVTLQSNNVNVTGVSFEKLLRYYMGGNYSTEEYLNHIKKHGFYSPYCSNLNIRIEDI